jgi:outer membrane lipoprotein SlyB
MNKLRRWAAIAVTVLGACGAGVASAQSVSFGRITNVTMVTQDNPGARGAGTLIGGALGATVGSGRSGSNRALGGIGGAVAGNQIARMSTQRQAFQYTILLGGTQTVTMVSDQAGKRVGDCVAVERGQFNNLRLVSDSHCGPSPRAAQATVVPVQPTAADRSEAEACNSAKQQLIAADSDDAFDRAERRMRLLCGE